MLEAVQHLVEPEALFESGDRRGGAPDLQYITVVLVRWLRAGVVCDELQIPLILPVQRRRLRIAALHGLRDHRGICKACASDGSNMSAATGRFAMVQWIHSNPHTGMESGSLNSQCKYLAAGLRWSM